MKVLIIGGTGLISQYITAGCVTKGYEVYLYNRKGSANYPNQVKTILGDRYNYASFEQQMQSYHFDCVIDMIAFKPADVESAARAFKGRTKQYIFCSTVDVYTKNSGALPIKETSPIGARKEFDYAFQKVACEAVVNRCQKEGIFETTIIRPAHTHAPGNGIIHSLAVWSTGNYIVDRFKKGLKIICHGDGTSVWVTAHAKDVSVAFVNAIGNKAAFGEAFHATGEEWMTWITYYQNIAEAMGYPAPKLVFILAHLLQKYEPEIGTICNENFKYNNIFDNTKAKNILGYSYKTDFKTGIKEVIDWLESNGKVDKAETNPVYDKIISHWESIENSIVAC